MISLSPQYQTTTQTIFNGSTTTTTTDTLLIDTVTLSLSRGSITLRIRKGTMIGTPAAFVDTAPALQIIVAPNGSFYSTDKSWSGTFTTLSAFVATLSSIFDGAVLSSGVITGTEYVAPAAPTPAPAQSAIPAATPATTTVTSVKS